MHHRTIGDRIFDWFNIIFFILFGLITLYPFWSTLMVSFLNETGYYGQHNMFQMMNIYPMAPTFRAWQFIFSTRWVVSGFFNSVLYTVAGSAWMMFLICTAAYGMSKKDLKGKRVINFYFLVTMWFGGGIVPYYLLISRVLGWENTRIVMIVPATLGVWGYLVLKNFISNISASLIESARIDGAKEYTILGRIILPLSLPCISTLTMFQMIARWNDWFTGRIFLTSAEYLYPLPTVLYRYIIEGTGRGNSAAMAELEKARQMQSQGYMIFEPARDAALVMCVVLPIVFVYPFIQKYFEKGVLIGSLKE